MQWPSFSLILCQLFLLYIAYSVYTLCSLFVTPKCEETKVCLTSYLTEKPSLDLYIYSSVTKNPLDREISLIYRVQNFNYSHIQDIPVTLNIPRKTQQNGTLYLHFFLVPESAKYIKSFSNLKKDPYLSYVTIKATHYMVPEAEVFSLLGEKKPTTKLKRNIVQPISHIKSRISFTMMTDVLKLPVDNVPLELIQSIRIVRGNVFLPIVNSDFLQTRHRDLVRVTSQTEELNITISYTPTSLGKLRLILHVEAAMQSLKNLGFSDKDIDEIKGIFADTNIYLMAATFFIAAVHLVFDFLAFKNDISFWRSKTNLAGLSTWTVIWRAFSHTVVFLYLLDENSSLLVVIPAGIGSIIEVWKLKKILRIQFVRGNGILPKIKFNNARNNEAELKTKEFDAESMRYLSYLLYPLVVGGAIYSLLYQPHKSWYSWSINSLVNGVYAFGFLFMLPQLFVNYKLKSVAHLPWKAFMYKAFNTFIDDLFAFIITMPAAHRIACFRDDAVFLIYLYQRWLYPVDKSRIDTDLITEETVNVNTNSKKTN